MLANVKKMLFNCKGEKKALGAFNISNLETLQAVVNAGVATRRPVIIQITDSTLEYAGDYEIVSLARNMIEKRSGDIPMAVHLDHGRNFEICKRAIDLGFNSIMIDGSHLSFEENKNLTKLVTSYAQKYGVTVQGELGTVPYLGKHLVNGSSSVWDEYMTDPNQVAEFVNYTLVDTLAVGIGNAHGFQKERDVPDWERLERITEKVKIPLILHGASDWKYGRVTKAIEKGITCFNVDTDIRLAFVSQLCNIFDKKCTIEDPRKIMGRVKDSVQKKVEDKIKMFSLAF
jgi:tagatose 1,6-diphosphate aldolase GatY/KbaY